MNKNKLKNDKKIARKGRVRAKISGDNLRPRLSVFRSNTGMFAQLIDDTVGQTLVSAHIKELKEKGAKTALSFGLGKLIAEKALAKKIKIVVFDKGGSRYHGRVKALADGAREGGLEF